MRTKVSLPKSTARKRARTAPQGAHLAGDDDGTLGLPASKVLLICCGSNHSQHSLYEQFVKLGVVCDGYDALNGPQSDPADTYVFDKIHRDVRAGEYAAGYACPDTTMFAKLRSTTGSKRYSNLAELT